MCSGQSNMEYPIGSPTCWNASDINCTSKHNGAQCGFGCTQDAGQTITDMANYDSAMRLFNVRVLDTVCCVYTCRRLIDLSNDCFVYTCRRLIDLSLIAGGRWARHDAATRYERRICLEDAISDGWQILGHLRKSTHDLLQKRQIQQ